MQAQLNKSMGLLGLVMGARVRDHISMLAQVTRLRWQHYYKAEEFLQIDIPKLPAHFSGSWAKWTVFPSLSLLAISC